MEHIQVMLWNVMGDIFHNTSVPLILAAILYILHGHSSLMNHQWHNCSKIFDFILSPNQGDWYLTPGPCQNRVSLEVKEAEK